MDAVPAVSVVVSTFNRAASLGTAIDALVRQQVPPDLDFEIIIVDNNSSDETRAVVDTFAATDSRVRYVLEMQQGVSHGRNAGIRAARAPIVAFTDDDNTVAADWVAQITSTLDNHPDAAGVGGRVLPQWSGRVPRWLDRRHWSPLAILDYGDRSFYTSATNPKCLLTANLAVRRNSFSTTGEFSATFRRCQDHELLIRMWRSGAHVLYAPELVAYAPVARERMTRRYHRKWYKAHGAFTAMMRLQEIIDAQGHLADSPADVPRLFGTPGFVYRAAAHQVVLWFKALVRGDRSGVQAHGDGMRDLASYIRQTARLRTSRRNAAADAASFVRAHLARAAAAGNLLPSRLALVHVLLAVLLGASAYDIITGREHWPISPYPMFSSVERQATLDGVRLFGVTDEAPPREIPLLDRSMIAPFDQTRLSTAMARAIADPGRRPLVDDMLRDCLLRYQRLRALGTNAGPSLRAIRLYDVHWTLDSEAANVDSPDRRLLLGASDRDIATGGTRAAEAMSRATN
jgi:glycosyltransferase involved in cell wall biosynthesis